MSQLRVRACRVCRRGAVILGLAGLTADLQGQPSAIASTQSAVAPEAQPAAAPAPSPGAATIDVTVVDGKGQPITGLDAAAFRVRIGDKPRSVSAVQFVTAAASDGATASPAAGGRIVSIVIDQASVFRGGEKGLAAVAAALLDRLLPGDRVALTVLPGPDPRVPLTGEVSVVQEALARIEGTRSPELANFGMGVGEAFGILESDTFLLTSVADRECRFSNERATVIGNQAQSTATTNPRTECIRKIYRDVEAMTMQARRASAPVYRGLLDAVSSLREAPGPKAVILITGGMAVDRDPGAFAELGARAAAAGVSVHALLVEPQPGSGSGPRLRPVNPINDRRSLDQRLDDLTAEARGTSQVVGARSDAALDALSQEMTGYYRLTVALDADDTADTRQPARRLTIEVPGRGATVRVRPYLGSGAAPATRGTPSKEERLGEALRGGAATQIPMRAAGYVLLRSSGAPSLLIAGDADLAGGGATQAGGLSVQYALFDEKQQPVLTGAFPTAATEGGRGRVSFAGALDDLPAGRYLLRVATTDAEGRTGSVEQQVDVRVSAFGNLSSGDLVLARLGDAASGAAPAAGAFEPGDGIGLQVDLAGTGARASDVTARFIVAAEGVDTALVTIDASVAPASAAGVGKATGVIRAGLLPPGRYQARAEIARGGKPLGTVVRSFDVALAAPAPGAAGAAVAASSTPSNANLWSLLPRFSRQAMLTPEALDAALTRLETRPGARAAAGRARAQAPESLAIDAELKAKEPLAAAFLEGVALFARGELEPAAGRFREALRLDADFYPAMVYLGACYAAGGRDREAVGAWQTALVDQGDHAAVYRVLVGALLRLQDTAAAQDFLDEAQPKWPADPAFVEQRIVVDLLAGRVAEALVRLDTTPSASADTLFLALTVLYEANTSGAPWGRGDAARQRMTAYAGRYRAAGGPQQALVDAWVAAVK